MINIYLVRHGEAEGNLRGVVMGQADYKLTEAGRRQAAQSIDRFRNKQITKVIASDLSRAYETAGILAKGLGIEKVIIEPQVAERNFGIMQDKSKSELKERFKKQFEELELLSNEAKLAYKFSGEMESADAAVDRLLNFLNQIEPIHQGENIIIVTHSGIMGPLLVKLGVKDFDVPVAGGGIGHVAHINIVLDKGRLKVIGLEGISNLLA